MRNKNILVFHSNFEDDLYVDNDDGFETRTTISTIPQIGVSKTSCVCLFLDKSIFIIKSR